MFNKGDYMQGGGVTSAAVCLYRLREVCVCVCIIVCMRERVQQALREEGEERRALLFLFSINLLFISMECSLYSLR